MNYRFTVPYFIKSKLLILCLALSWACIGVSNSYAQQVETSNSELSYWVHGGPSITTLGTGVSGGVVFDYNRHVFSLRTTSTDTNYGTETWDIALLYGRSVRYKTLYISGGVGAAVTGGTKYSQLLGSTNGEQMETMIGFPLEGHLSWEPTNFLALGLYSFVNVNTEQPFGGLGVTLRIGRL